MIRALLIAALMGCSALPARAEAITALVAASAKDAVGEIAAKFTADTQVEVKIVPGASNALAQQIIQGAPADVFLSASGEWMKAVEAEGLVAQSSELLGNELVIVAPKDGPDITSPSELLRDDVRRVALAGENVPAGKYAEQALRFHDVFDALDAAKKIVRGQDVRSTLAYVARGEVDAGIVYATDARITEDVKVVHTFKAESHDPIVYPAALLKAAEKNQAAGKFYAFLSSPQAAEIFRRHGFTPMAAPATQPG